VTQPFKLLARCAPRIVSRRLDEQARRSRASRILYKIVRWRATVDEDGHYCFAVAL
jgi:hypothetical protein